MVTTAVTRDEVLGWLSDVADPEIPVLSVVDLGIIRGVTIVDDGVALEISPTYSGCPATEVIEQSVEDHLVSKGIGNVAIERVISVSHMHILRS